MSDGRQDDAAGASARGDGEGGDSDGNDGGVDAPGGGPRRVVSERSVDDVLDALRDGPAADAKVSSGDGEGTSSDDEDTEAVEETAGDEDATAERPDDAAEAEDGQPDLAARVETGDVTGADVRAAETGEGREATPDVDEIDLSIDDLDAGGSGSPSGGPADDRSGRSDDGPSGLLGRLRALFSR